ncbi:MAG: 30S ribosomal protein S2 [Deltaproteobacteria bacterium]|nr:30S ribosomal protein S2 [Deltaproteobacteria bacterium]MBI2974196.1 30S ribosomal protein S2 [Deltaproteobacteria bacterium]
MSELSVKDLLEAGCHFGHQTARWNPKMKPFIYAAKNGVHIINLDKTVETAAVAYKFVADRVALGESVIFVGTKRQAADIIREQAERAGMYYVNQRWLGGMLTNFKTIKASIDRLQALYQRRDTGEFAKLTKKEGLSHEREIGKLEHSLGGIKNMTKLPGIVFIVDPKTEHIALHEAQRLKLPIVSITDTNCDPDNIDFVVPANDDAIRSITLLIGFIADACVEGLKRREAVIREEVAKEGAVKGASEASGRVREKKMAGKAKAYVADIRPDNRKGKKGPSKQVKTEKTATPEVKKEVVTS